MIAEGSEPAQTTIEHPGAHGWVAHLIDWISEHEIVSMAIVAAFAGGCATLWYCIKRIIDYKYPNCDGRSPKK